MSKYIGSGVMSRYAAGVYRLIKFGGTRNLRASLLNVMRYCDMFGEIMLGEYVLRASVLHTLLNEPNIKWYINTGVMPMIVPVFKTEIRRILVMDAGLWDDCVTRYCVTLRQSDCGRHLEVAITGYYRSTT